MARRLGDLIEMGVDVFAGALGLPAPNDQAAALGELLSMAAPMVAAPKAAMRAILPMRVKDPIKGYHGSPYDFDRFDMSKIGTGEGAQAYGHGLYFAENPGVAKSYRDALAPPEVRVGGKPHPALNTESPIDMAIADLANGKPMSDEVLARGFDPRFAQEYKQALQKYQGQVERVNPGRLYEVNIHADPADLLDWDAPLSRQSEKVRQALGSYSGPVDLRDGMPLAGGGKLRVVSDPDMGPRYFLEHGDGKQFRLSSEDVGNLVGQSEGRTAYQNATTRLGSDAATSQALRDAGIPGIKYLDGMSRSAGEGSRNYVIFDDRRIEIIRKLGLAGAVSAGLLTQAEADGIANGSLEVRVQ